jgi:hypothetical protein
MSEALASPVVRSFLEIPRAVGESDKDECCFDAIQDSPQELLTVSAQGSLCRVYSFVLDGQTSHFSRKIEVCIEFDKEVASVAFSCETYGRTENHKLLFALTRDGCLWCFREKDLRLSGRWTASTKCAASLSSQRLLAADVLTACPDVPILIVSGHTLGPPQLIHFVSVRGEIPIMTMKSYDFPRMERVESLVTSVLCLSKETMSLELQTALYERYRQDYDYDAAAVLGLADGTVRVSMVTLSDRGIFMSPTRLLGWMSGEDRQAVVAVVPSRGDENFVDSLLWFGSSGQIQRLNNKLETCYVCTELQHGGKLVAAVPVATDNKDGSRLVLAVKRDGTSHIYSFFGQLGGASDFEAPFSAKVPLREDLRSIKCFHPPPILLTNGRLNCFNFNQSSFIGATTNGTLIGFNLNQSVGEEICFDTDASSTVQSPLEVYWREATSTPQASPRLESLLRNVERLERREEREVAASELEAAADDASHVSQMIQEVHGQRKRVRIGQDNCRRVATMVDELQKDKSKGLPASLHVCIESNQSAIASRTVNDGKGRDVVYGGTVVSVSNTAASSQQQSVVFEKSENETVSYYTSLSIDGRKRVNSKLGIIGEQPKTLIFTAEADPIV